MSEQQGACNTLKKTLPPPPYQRALDAARCSPSSISRSAAASASASSFFRAVFASRCFRSASARKALACRERGVCINVRG